MTVASKRVANTESPQPAKKVAISPIDGAEQSPIPVLKPAVKSCASSPSPAAGNETKVARPFLPLEKEAASCDMEDLMSAIVS